MLAKTMEKRQRQEEGIERRRRPLVRTRAKQAAKLTFPSFSLSLSSLLKQEMCAQMYYRGKMFGFVHLYSGQEAVSTGVIR